MLPQGVPPSRQPLIAELASSLESKQPDCAPEVASFLLIVCMFVRIIQAGTEPEKG